MKRLYVGGLDPQVTEQDLRNRFKSFGTIKSCEFPTPKNAETAFAFVQLETTPEQLKKCFSIYHGTKWKGRTLKIEEAKSDYVVKWQKEASRLPTVKSLSKKKLKKRAVQHSLFMEPVTTDSPLAATKGWAKAGRLVPVVKIRHPKTSRVIKVDPFKSKAVYQTFDMEPGDHVSWEPIEYSVEQETRQRKRCGIFTPEEQEEARAYQAQLKLQEQSRGQQSTKKWIQQEQERTTLDLERKAILQMASKISHDAKDEFYFKPNVYHDESESDDDALAARVDVLSGLSIEQDVAQVDNEQDVAQVDNENKVNRQDVEKSQPTSEWFIQETDTLPKKDKNSIDFTKDPLPGVVDFMDQDIVAFESDEEQIIQDDIMALFASSDDES